MEKKAFMRVVEATIAVLVVLGVLLVLSSQRQDAGEYNSKEQLSILLDEIAQNLTFRINILNGTDENSMEQELNAFVQSRIDSATLNSSVEICEVNESCFLEPYPDTESEILTEERILGATIKESAYSPKTVKIFIWRKL